MRSTIICVDDEKMLLEFLYDQLNLWFGKNYNIEKAISGEEALKIVDRCISNGKSISIVISDYIMPYMKGDELLKKINEKDSRIKKIMLTGYTSVDGIINAINNAGLYRYITKPWDKKDLLLTILEAIKSYEKEILSSELLKNYEDLKKDYKNLSDKVEKGFNTAIETISRASDIRTLGATGHAGRVAQYSNFIAMKINYPKDRLKILNQACYLHDVGKLAFTDEELKQLHQDKCNNTINFDLRKKQLDYTEEILKDLFDYDDVMKIIKYQFEEYCGSGLYHLAKDNIPIESRILAVANQFDFYKNKVDNKYKLEEIINIMLDCGGTMFDNNIIEIFINIIKPQTNF